MSEEEKTRKPRSRERGPGKNNKGRTAKTISFSCTPEEYAKIKELATLSQMPFGRFMVQKVLG